MKGEKLLRKLARGGALLSTLGVIPTCFMYNVDGGEKAVMFNRFRGGVSPRPVSEGTHFYLPWFQMPVVYDVRVKPKVINTTTGTKDLQTVSLSLRLLFRPSTEFLPRLHQTLGPDYDEKVLPSVGNEILKAVVAKYDAESLLTQREKVSREVRECIVQRTRQFDIIMEDVAITHLTYGKEFERAIEEKQVAQQEAERAKFVAQKAEYERQAVVVRASGEAQAAEMISRAVSDSGWGIVDVRRLEGARDIVENLARSDKVTFVQGHQQHLHFGA